MIFPFVSNQIHFLLNKLPYAFASVKVNKALLLKWKVLCYKNFVNSYKKMMKNYQKNSIVEISVKMKKECGLLERYGLADFGKNGG